jgi:hypothetical protein
MAKSMRNFHNCKIIQEKNNKHIACLGNLESWFLKLIATEMFKYYLKQEITLNQGVFLRLIKKCICKWIWNNGIST